MYINNYPFLTALLHVSMFIHHPLGLFYYRVKKNQIDAQLILHLKRIISTKRCIHKVVPPDDGPRYARNM